VVMKTLEPTKSAIGVRKDQLMGIGFSEVFGDGFKAASMRRILQGLSPSRHGPALSSLVAVV
jgi:hypothetical protein